MKTKCYHAWDDTKVCWFIDAYPEVEIISITSVGNGASPDFYVFYRERLKNVKPEQDD